MEYDKEILEKTGIFVFNNAVSDKLCDDTIAHFYDNADRWHKGLTGGGYKNNVKNTTDFWLREEKISKPFFNCLNLALEKILEIRIGLRQYKDFQWSGLQFQKNHKGQGFFKWHSDNNEPDIVYARLLAPIFYLNNVEEGGETEFMYQKFRVKPEKGKLVIFPSTWDFYHRGVIPKSNNKYIITSFGLTRRR